MGIPTIEEDMTALVELSRKIVSNPRPEKAGGFMFVGANGLTTNISPLSIGNYDPEKAHRYSSLAQEKAYRLYADWLRDPASISSYQTAQESLDRWGGAVLFNHIIPDFFEGERKPSCSIVSFSGLSWQADEAVSLAYGYFGREFPQEWQENARRSHLAERIIEVSGNQVAKEMLEVLNKKGFGFYQVRS